MEISECPPTLPGSNLNIASGGLTLNGSVSVQAFHVTAPSGSVTINGGAQLVGGLAVADQLTINGNGLLRLLSPVAANQPPVVALTAPASGASFTAPAAFALSATASDSDGTVAKVEFYEGAAKLGEDTIAPFALNLTGIAAGNHTYKARAIDNQGTSAESAAVTITVTAANLPPTVTLSAPLNGAYFIAPKVITLTASAADSDGSVAKVEFYQGATKLGEDVTTPYQFTTGSLFVGTYVFSARAIDNLGASTTSGSAAVTIVAPNLAPAVSVTSPVNGASFNAPAGFLLTASASDPDGSIAKVDFYQDGTKLGQDIMPPFEFPVNGLAAGTYQFLARATDNAGLAADSVAVTVAVVTPNVPPMVALTAPAGGASFTAPATIPLAATASDSDGMVAKVEFFNGTTKLGEKTAAPFQFAWASVAPGTYVLSAKATDNAGAITVSAPVTVTVANNGLPFLANFELAEGYQIGPLSGQNGWVVDGLASIVTAPLYAGQQAVSVAPSTPPALLVKAFVNADPSVTFVDLFVQPATGAEPASAVFFETDAARVALTGAGPRGILQAFDGDGAGSGIWSATDRGPLLDAAGRAKDWLRLTTRTDYTAKKWDLYLNGQMIAANLGLLDNSKTAFSGLGLSGHTLLTTGFDDLLIAFDNPLFVDADHDGMDDAWEIAHGLNPAMNDRDDDPDRDGLTNIQEYVLGTNPPECRYRRRQAVRRL